MARSYLKVFTDFVKGLDDVDGRDAAAFVRALRAGDEIGVWSRVVDHHGSTNQRENELVVEGWRVDVFWEV